MNNNSCCIRDILMVINALQNGAEQIDDCINTCDRPFLGNNTIANALVYNTRPVNLYTSNNDLIEIEYTLNGTTATSSVFRVEKANKNAVTLRVLAPNSDTTSIYPYVRTDSFITVNTNCICAVMCLSDTYVDCV